MASLATDFFPGDPRGGVLHETSLLRDLDVRYLRVHRRERGALPRLALLTLRVAHRGQYGRTDCHKQLHHLQLSLVLTGSVHAARMRHRTEASWGLALVGGIFVHYALFSCSVKMETNRFLKSERTAGGQ